MSGSCVAEKHYTMQTVDRCDREYGANTTEIMCKATSNFEYYGYVGDGKYLWDLDAYKNHFKEIAIKRWHSRASFVLL